MNKKYSIKKGKGAFLYDIKGGRFYDFQKNSNILGHSYKKLTTIVKNNISSKWNISEDTVSHKRMRKLFEDLFTSNYYLTSVSSLSEFIFRLNNYALYNSFNLNISGERFNLWFSENCNLISNDKKDSKKNIIIYDMAEFFLQSEGNFNEFIKIVKKIKKEEITILNYFWYPYLNIDTCNADIVILPEIYSGNFNYINVLINKKSIDKYKQLTTQLENIPALYLASSLKMFYLIKNIDTSISVNLNRDNIIQAGRLFSYKELNAYNKEIDKYADKNIVLSKKPPFYNYLPLILEEYQIKYLTKIKV